MDNKLAFSDQYHSLLLSSSSPLFSTFSSCSSPSFLSKLCGDTCWTALDSDGNLSPCFVNSVILIVPPAIILLFGFFAPYSHAETYNSTTNLPWYYHAKIVSLKIMQILNQFFLNRILIVFLRFWQLWLFCAIH